MVTSGSLTFALIEGGDLGWRSAPVVIAFALAIAGAAAFLTLEQRGRSPMLPLALFRAAGFSATAAVGLLLNLGLYGQIFVMALYFERGARVLAPVHRLTFLPMTLTVVGANLLCGWLVMRSGPRALVVTGLLVAAAGLAALVSMGPATGYAAMVLPLIAVGGGWGPGGAGAQHRAGGLGAAPPGGHRRRGLQHRPPGGRGGGGSPSSARCSPAVPSSPACASRSASPRPRCWSPVPSPWGSSTPGWRRTRPPDSASRGGGRSAAPRRTHVSARSRRRPPRPGACARPPGAPTRPAGSGRARCSRRAWRRRGEAVTVADPSPAWVCAGARRRCGGRGWRASIPSRTRSRGGWRRPRRGRRRPPAPAWLRHPG